MELAQPHATTSSPTRRPTIAHLHTVSNSLHASAAIVKLSKPAFFICRSPSQRQIAGPCSGNLLTRFALRNLLPPFASESVGTQSLFVQPSSGGHASRRLRISRANERPGTVHDRRFDCEYCASALLTDMLDHLQACFIVNRNRHCHLDLGTYTTALCSPVTCVISTLAFHESIHCKTIMIGCGTAHSASGNGPLVAT